MQRGTTDRQTAVTNIHFSSATPNVKCDKLSSSLAQLIKLSRCNNQQFHSVRRLLTAREGGLVLITDSNNSFTKSDSFEDTNRLQSSVDEAQISSRTRYNFFCNVLSASSLYNKFQLNAVTNTGRFSYNIQQFLHRIYILDKYII